MPRGDKSKYTDKQDRKAEHIEQSYESRGVPEEAERRAWATVNKDDGGGGRWRIRPRQIDWPSGRAQGRADRRRGVGRAIAGEPIGRGRKRPPPP